ncbi:MAG: glycosyltransferase family A protein [Bacteroidales bacterium]|nr:glycosyltransferase family A protein [Bacteroidales bacterium]
MKISVVIPLYNKKETVLRALDSVLNQTVLPEEIIVVNDGSTDGSEQVVAQLDHPLIRLVSQSNQGVSAARNRGVAEAKNEWIAFLDADDEWLPEFFQTITELHENYPDCSVAATAYYMQDTESRRERNHLSKLKFKGDNGIIDNYFQVASCSHPPLNSSAVAIKKEAIESIGGFPAGVTSGEDLLTWARLAAVFTIAYAIKPQSVFTQDPAHLYVSKPNRMPQNPDIVGMNLAAIARANKRLPGIRRYVSHWHKMRSSIYLRLGMRGESLRESIISLSYYPLNFKVMLYLLLLGLPASSISHIFRKSVGK